MRATNVVLCVFLSVAATRAEPSWPQFRGPDGQGRSTAVGLPISFGEANSLTWKTSLPGLGWSSPVGHGRMLWMTTAVDNTTGGKSLRVLGIETKSGQIRRDVEVFTVQRLLNVNAKNTHASPTPVLDGNRLFVHFGSYGTACVDTESAKVVWRNVDQQCDHQEGPGSSPVLHEDRLIFHCDGRDVQFVVALDKRTGQVVWKTSRSGKMAESSDMRKAFSTPLIIKVDGRDVLVSPGAFHVWGYDPRTGAELWRVTTAPGFSTVPRPVFGNGLVYLSTGYFTPNLLAIRPDGKGDIKSTHVVWKHSKRVPANASPLLLEDEPYFVSDNGFVTCLDARTGAEIWVHRLGGSFSASPIAADHRLYFSSEEGKVLVLQAGRVFKLLATNQLDGRLMASPAVVDKALYLRTDRALYRFEKR